jgi:hypothetical protein
LTGFKEDLEKAVDAMKADIERGPGFEGERNDEDWGLIHGDFWSGKRVVPFFPCPVSKPS